MIVIGISGIRLATVDSAYISKSTAGPFAANFFLDSYVIVIGIAGAGLAAIDRICIGRRIASLFVANLFLDSHVIVVGIAGIGFTAIDSVCVRICQGYVVVMGVAGIRLAACNKSIIIISSENVVVAILIAILTVNSNFNFGNIHPSKLDRVAAGLACGRIAAHYGAHEYIILTVISNNSYRIAIGRKRCILRIAGYVAAIDGAIFNFSHFTSILIISSCFTLIQHSRIGNGNGIVVGPRCSSARVSIRSIQVAAGRKRAQRIILRQAGYGQGVVAGLLGIGSAIQRIRNLVR